MEIFTCLSSSDFPGILSMKNLMFSSRLKNVTYMKLNINREYLNINDRIACFPPRLFPGHLLLEFDLQDGLRHDREA